MDRTHRQREEFHPRHSLDCYPILAYLRIANETTLYGRVPAFAPLPEFPLAIWPLPVPVGRPLHISAQQPKRPSLPGENFARLLPRRESPLSWRERVRACPYSIPGESESPQSGSFSPILAHLLLAISGRKGRICRKPLTPALSPPGGCLISRLDKQNRASILRQAQDRQAQNERDLPIPFALSLSKGKSTLSNALLRQAPRERE